MLGRGASVALLVLVGLSYAEPAPKPVDVAAYKDKLLVLKDADGGIYAVLNEKGGERHVFFGTPKVLHEAIYEGGGGRDGDAWSVSVHAPRVPYPFMGNVERRKDGSYQMTCGEKQTLQLTELTGDVRKAILDKAKFLTTQVIRRPYLLARDDRGVYYYVDVLRDIYGGADHRVFVGKRGALKQMALVDVASDSAGDVFSTKTGDLRLVNTRNQEGHEIKKTMHWIRGERKSELVYLDPYMNQGLIYRDLGVYKYAGTICGNI